MNNFFPPVSPINFTEAMETRWTSVLNNKPSPALRKLWKQMAGAYGSHILQHDDPEQRSKWLVLDPPTGSGKTQGLMLYCSMMADVSLAQHPGVLIVTRLIHDADTIAAEINKLSNKTDYAVSHHSEKAQPTARDNLRDFPVLVITHSAYSAALNNLHDEQAFNQTWPLFNEWQGEGRRLVVVDEAPSLTQHFHIDLDELRQTLGAMPQTFREKHANGSAVIADLVQIIEFEAGEGTCTERILPRYQAADGGRAKLTLLRNDLRNIRFDEQSGTTDSETNQRLHKLHHDRIGELQNVLGGDMYYACLKGKHTLNSSRPIVPEGVKGAVVLDATASVNVMYQLFNKASALAMPKGVRSYKNVTIYVNRGQNVGKGHLTKNSNKMLPPIIDDLNTRLAGRDVFVATHKGIKQKVLAEKATFKRDVGTWGAIDGSNAWKDCDTAVILGLRCMPDSWTANVFFALQGMQQTEWLQNKARPFGKHDDIRSALKTGQTISEVVQGINRMRCRQVVDGDGNCPDAEVYLMLPEGAWGDTILKGITDLMEGVIVKTWVVEGFEPKTTCRGRPSGTGTAFHPLLQTLKDMLPGRVLVSDLANQTNASKPTLKRFIADFKKETTTAVARLKALGISYVTEGRGRSAVSFFQKA